MSSIKDVARLAGVSIATVSRTLADPDKVAEATRSRIEAAIQHSGYVRNEVARSLRMQRSKTVLVLIPDIGNPFYSLIIQGLEEIASEHHYQILLADLQNRHEREVEFLQRFTQRQVDGVISLGHTLPEVPQLKGREPIPVVMACEYLHDSSISSISIDNITAAREATEHLIALGHREIAFINGPASSPLSTDRLRGYRDALTAADIGATKAHVLDGDFTLASGERAAQQLLDSGGAFSAIFAASDAMAIGAIKALLAGGRHVPHDVSVIGFDDIEFAAYAAPPLTTIHQPRRDIGRAAMRHMLAKLDGSAVTPEQVVLKHQLVVRQSTAPRPTLTIRRPAN